MLAGTKIPLVSFLRICEKIYNGNEEKKVRIHYPRVQIVEQKGPGKKDIIKRWSEAESFTIFEKCDYTH